MFYLLRLIKSHFKGHPQIISGIFKHPLYLASVMPLITDLYAKANSRGKKPTLLPLFCYVIYDKPLTGTQLVKNIFQYVITFWYLTCD